MDTSQPLARRMEQLGRRLKRNWRIGARVLESDFREAGGVGMFYPGQPWYAENGPELMRVLRLTMARLEDGLGLAFPDRLICLVTDPDWAAEELGVAGLAFDRTVLVACPRRHLSAFAGVAAHELAHVLSMTIGPLECPFKSEGFACYAAEITDADTLPCGLPLHYHLVWMLSVGLRPTLPELWERRDYTPELYDLAWSFATFLAETYGLRRYLSFFGAEGQELDARIRDLFETSPAALERDWYAAARAAVRMDGREIGRLGRLPARVCSRAAWLSNG